MKTGTDTLNAVNAIVNRKAVGVVIVVTLRPREQPEVLYTAADLQPHESMGFIDRALVEIKKQLP